MAEEENELDNGVDTAEANVSTAESPPSETTGNEAGAETQGGGDNRKKTKRKVLKKVPKKRARKKAGAESDDAAADEAGKKKAVAETSEADGSETEADGKAKAEPEPDPGPPAPELINLNEFQEKSVSELYELGASLGLRVGGSRSKHQLIFDILSFWGRKGTKVEAEGILETANNDSYGFLRWPVYNFTPYQEDVYLPTAMVRELKLKKGNQVKGIARPPRDREKFISMEQVTEVEGVPVENWSQKTPFDDLTAISPRERIILEKGEDSEAVSARVVDIVAPLGKGQRGVIVAPPRGGKTILLKEIAGSITHNHSEIELIILLLDERPEEVTDFEESVDASVFSSTFDETPERHVQVAELVAERAKRLVEHGRDVVILLDSLTRLARGYNGLTKGKGRTMSGGIEAKALQRSRKLFNIARNVEEGGSLTMLATALIDTGSRMDEVIFEEFKGSGNMEIELDRELLEMRIFPAINIPKSGTRKDDLLYHPDELKKINVIRRQLAARPGGEAMEVLIRNIKATSSNTELLLGGLRD